MSHEAGIPCDACDHIDVEHFRELEEFYDDDASPNSDFFFKMTLNAATYYNHTALITRMLADPRCQLHCWTSSTMFPVSALEEMMRPQCFLKRVKFIETVLSVQKVAILTKL